MDKQAILIKLGQKIKSERTMRGLSQLELATNVGIEKTNLSRIERGLTNPTFFSLFVLAQALDIPLKELVDIEF